MCVYRSIRLIRELREPDRETLPFLAPFLTLLAIWLCVPAVRKSAWRNVLSSNVAASWSLHAGRFLYGLERRCCLAVVPRVTLRQGLYIKPNPPSTPIGSPRCVRVPHLCQRERTTTTAFLTTANCATSNSTDDVAWGIVGVARRTRESKLVQDAELKQSLRTLALVSSWHFATSSGISRLDQLTATANQDAKKWMCRPRFHAIPDVSRARCREKCLSHWKNSVTTFSFANNITLFAPTWTSRYFDSFDRCRKCFTWGNVVE